MSVFPDAVSGIFGSKESAQSQVSVGVGINAGITVFSLTIQWGMVMIYGKIDLNKISDELSEAFDSITSPSKARTWILKGLAPQKLIVTNILHFLLTIFSFLFVCLTVDSGVKIDKLTSYTAGIMLLSLIPYVVLQLVFVFTSSSGNRIITLTALTISSISLLSYFTYQVGLVEG